jgi:hypothetical protein
MYLMRQQSADGGGRTHTSFEGQWILSPSRLPIPPRRRLIGSWITSAFCEKGKGSWSARDLSPLSNRGVRRKRRNAEACPKFKRSLSAARLRPPTLHASTLDPVLFASFSKWLSLRRVPRNLKVATSRTHSKTCLSYDALCSISSMAQQACSETRGSSDAARSRSTGRSASLPELPIATQTFRRKRR